MAQRHLGQLRRGAALHPVAGTLRVCHWIVDSFATLHAETQGGDTLPTGALADEAAPPGVLAQIEALELELVEVRRLPVGNRRESPGSVTPPHPGARNAEPN
jgi:hypothetical protein